MDQEWASGKHTAVIWARNGQVVATQHVIGVRGVPERDILSLCVMEWRLDRFGNSSAAAAVAVAVAVAAVSPQKGPKSDYLVKTDLFVL